MKSINTYIQEKLIIGNNLTGYNYHPKTKDELIKCIKDKIKKEGLGTKDKSLNLNDIDTSKITNMSYLFDSLGGELEDLSNNGYFDISDWDVSNVKEMEWMFRYSTFNEYISDWDVSHVENMHGMFTGSDFEGNISNWDVSNVKYIGNIFINCPLENNPPKWFDEYFGINR